MQELKEVVQSKLDEMIKDGAIEKMLHNGLEKAVSESVGNMFRSYGPVTKQLEKAMEEGLRIDVSQLPFESYNQQMLVAVKEKLGAAFAETSPVFMAELDKLLEPAPSEISMTDLVNKIASYWKVDDPYNDGDEVDEYASVEWEHHDWSWSDDSYSLRMWKQKESRFGSTNSPDLHLFISGGTVRINHRHGYNPTNLSKEDAFIFKLYSAQTKITGCEHFDEDDCDLALKEWD